MNIRRAWTNQSGPLLNLCVLLFSPSLPFHAGWLKPDVDFSNYDVPLYDQIVNRIKAKVSARLGEGENKQDRYFIIPFAYQDKWLSPKISHSFISVIRVFAEDRQPVSDRDSDTADTRDGISKHLPLAGCLAISILIRIYAFSMASAAALFRHQTNAPSPSVETSHWLKHSSSA